MGQWPQRCGDANDSWPGPSRGRSQSVSRLRTLAFLLCELTVAELHLLLLPFRGRLRPFLDLGCGLIAAAPAGEDWTRMRTVRGHELIATATCPAPVRIRGRAAPVALSNSYCEVVWRLYRDLFADAESFGTKG